MQNPPGPQIPPDDLIKHLLATSRTPTDRERKILLSHIATATMDATPVKLPAILRGLTYNNVTLAAGMRFPNDFIHLVKRVLIEKQLPFGATLTDYLNTVREAAEEPQARLVLYYRSNNEPIVGVLSPNTVPSTLLGPNPEPFLFVAYSPNLGKIITSYQVEGVHTLQLGANLLWSS